MHVLIVGGGVGGLCLAQGLHKRGISVAVLERDTAAEARAQGLRLKIDWSGRQALSSCLSDRAYELFVATSNPPYQSRGITLDEHLNVVGSSVGESAPLDPATASTVVNRHTLRQILLAGIEDRVTFGKEFNRYEVVDNRVVAHCRDGSMWIADVLVGADGINSAVRCALVPEVDLIDTGLMSIYGQLMLTEENRSWMPETVFGGSRPVLGPDRVTLALGTFQPEVKIAEAVARYYPEAGLTPVEDYLKWNLIAPAKQFDMSAGELHRASATVLHRIAGEMTANWSPVIRRIIAESLVAVTFPLRIRATRPGAVWPPSRITLLGDAIHATTPVGGVGANTALRDAALLAESLSGAVNCSDDVLLAAIGGYEAKMRDYGYRAVHDSLHGAERIFRTAPVVG